MRRSRGRATERHGDMGHGEHEEHRESGATEITEDIGHGDHGDHGGFVHGEHEDHGGFGYRKREDDRDWPRRTQRGCAATKERIRAGSNQCLLVTLPRPQMCQENKLWGGSVTKITKVEIQSPKLSVIFVISVAKSFVIFVISVAESFVIFVADLSPFLFVAWARVLRRRRACPRCKLDSGDRGSAAHGPGGG